MTRCWWVLGTWLLATSPALAQMSGTSTDRTIGASVSAASLWDDETHLGRGAAVALDAWTALGPHGRVGVEAGWLDHRRDSGYLAADGHALHLMGRGVWQLGPRQWRTRPFVGGGIGVARSTGTLTTRDPLALPFEREQSWRLTRFAWELHLGVRAAVGDRWTIRPELRAGAIGGTGRVAAIQPPLVRLQGGVAIERMLR